MNLKSYNVTICHPNFHHAGARDKFTNMLGKDGYSELCSKYFLWLVAIRRRMLRRFPSNDA